MGTHRAYPEVTAIDGGFAVAWYQWNGEIYGQAFSTASSGTPQKVGDEILANEEHTSGTQTEPAISQLADGGFLISWTDQDGSSGDRGGSSYDVYARRYDANGEPQKFSLSADVTNITGDGALTASPVVSGGDAIGVRIDGAAGDDALCGGDSRDTLIGGDNDDFISGGANDDTLTGDAGDDILIGGEG